MLVDLASSQLVWRYSIFSEGRADPDTLAVSEPLSRYLDHEDCDAAAASRVGRGGTRSLEMVGDVGGGGGGGGGGLY